MKLHENKELLRQAIIETSADLNIPRVFIEKDYWICQILQRLSRHDKSELTVWKGGTSLAKAYRLINRFSSDVDIAILSEQLSQNQQKKLVARIGHDSTIDLSELDNGNSIKNNRFRKTYHEYDTVLPAAKKSLDFLGRYVIFEINTYGNPYPYEKKVVTPFITEMMQHRGLLEMIRQYDMDPFELNVLDKRRTMCEKIVSLIRFSFENNPIDGLASKIRHFYDLHFMSIDKECHDYLTKDFSKNLIELIVHDKAEFDRPPKWKDADILSSILFTDFDGAWKSLSSKYKSELGELTYGELPKATEIAVSVKTLMEYVRMILFRHHCP